MQRVRSIKCNHPRSHEVINDLVGVERGREREKRVFDVLEWNTTTVRVKERESVGVWVLSLFEEVDECINSCSVGRGRERERDRERESERESE